MFIDMADNDTVPEEPIEAVSATQGVPSPEVDQETMALVTQTSRASLQTRLEFPDRETLRLALLEKLQKHQTLDRKQQKINTLAKGLTPEEMEQLMEYTRQTYMEMPSAQSALLRLDAALIKYFSENEAQELSMLARHAMGHYINIDQYHNAVHMLSMTRESLHLADIADIEDKTDILRALVIQGLYHDAGNGIHPVPPVNEQADEVQAVAIFVKDLREARMLSQAEKTPGLRKTLTKLGGVKINGKAAEQTELIAACIAATVFRDRFAPTSSLAFQQYVKSILGHVHRTDTPEFLPIQDLERFTQLMESQPAWIARDADIAGSTYTSHVLGNNLLNRGEDVLRGMGAESGFSAYHAGFIGFIGAGFHQGPVTDAVKAAREGSPLYLPQGEGDSAAIFAYGQDQLAHEKNRFEQLASQHTPMLNALFVLIGEAAAKGERFLQLPLTEIRIRLEQLIGDTNRVERARKILKQENIASLDIDLQRYPLLRDERYQTMTIPSMTPGLINRIFAPNTDRTKEQEEVASALETIEKNAKPDQQPILFSILELADLNPENITRESFEANQPIITKGTRPGRVFIILDGEVSIILNEQQTFSAGPGTVLGEISALRDQETTADCIATTNVNAISLPAELVAKEYRNEPIRLRMTDLMNERRKKDRS